MELIKDILFIVFAPIAVPITLLIALFIAAGLIISVRSVCKDIERDMYGN